MDHFEMVEKLREKTGVSYEEAKAALEAANWDLLDAIVVLEADGKITEGAKEYTTRQEDRREEHERKKSEFKSSMVRVGEHLARLVDKGNRTMFDVHRSGTQMFSVPMTVMVILLIFAPYVVLPMLVIGLFFGFTYRINSGGSGVNIVNSAMDKASEFAANIKTEVENNKKQD